MPSILLTYMDSPLKIKIDYYTFFIMFIVALYMFNVFNEWYLRYKWEVELWTTIHANILLTKDEWHKVRVYDTM